ncbi:MAG: GAF domain-containing protein [Hymenobacteraceae bacterium]|nr:GAF domain-containing protein [Hymenobacteraceae bacterium]MDX5480760.1 GAF domain-containing protein [Hymenobacteraceae bacterium]
MENTLGSPGAREKEEERLAKLYGYNITANYEKAGTFQHVVGMAAHIFKAPIAFVNFVDERSTWITDSWGMQGITELDRGVTLCSHAILRDGVTVFEDAKEEPCLLSNPFVHGDFGLQFYAGAPIRTPEGFNIGIVGIGDTRPRKFSREEEKTLEGLAAIVMEELEERRERLNQDSSRQG